MSIYSHALPLLATVSMITIVILSLYGSLSNAAEKFCHEEGLSMDVILKIAAYTGSGGVVVMWLKGFGFFSLTFSVLSMPFLYMSVTQNEDDETPVNMLKLNNGCVRVGLILFLLVFAGFIADGIYVLSSMPGDCLYGKYGENTSAVIMWIVFVFSIVFVMLFGFLISPFRANDK